MDPRVLAEMAPYYSESFGNPHSSDHSLGWDSARAIENAGSRVARLIGADADEVTFTSGATESNNMALLGLGRRARGRRRRILVSSIEHRCVLAAARVLEEQNGYIVEEIPVDHEGFVELSALDNMLAEDVLVVSVMAVNNEIGTVQNIQEISERVRYHGAVLHCDAAQAPLAVPMGTLASRADIVSLSGHKMYGPKGIGAVFIRRALQELVEPLIYGGGQQNGLRSGTMPVPLCVGMGAAAKYLTDDNATEKRKELSRRRDVFLRRLRGLRWPVWLNGPEGSARHPGNTNVRFTGLSAHAILGGLQPRLAASTGSACTSGVTEPSHVLRAIGLNDEEAEASIRFGLGFGTTDEDVEQSVDLIEAVLSRMSKADLTWPA